MSQATDPNSPFRQRLDDVNRLLSRNGSLSGHERNCLFLNTGTDRFATASAVTGFDFDDDTRGVATVDWDGDGDLDVWTTNRTSPRVRVLRNDQANENHFVSVKLEGTTCNRDAIGAKVEVIVDEASGNQRIVKTLRAGEGFLTQCSKWLHFGLGRHDRVRQIQVRWPGGGRESFTGFDIDQRYRCVQGEGTPQVVAQRRGISLNDELETTPAIVGPVRIPLTAKIPPPPLRYDDSMGDLQSIETGDPTLILIWASQCSACSEELHALMTKRQEITSRQLRIVAICIDPFTESAPPATASQSFLASIDFPFDHGVASPELIKRLQTVYDMPFAVPAEMATPTSFLLDRNGKLSAIYRGKIDLGELFKDVEQLGASDEAWSRYAEPYLGRWHQAPNQEPKLLRIPRELMDRGKLNDAVKYVGENQKALSQEKEFAKLAVWIGDQLIAKQRTVEALTHYQWALESDPNDLTVMNNVAWQFATHRDSRVRDSRQAIKWAERAARATKFSNAGVLDTLAASYAADHQFSKAIQVIERAIMIADQQQQASQKYSDRVKLYRAGRVLTQKD